MSEAKLEEMYKVYAGLGKKEGMETFKSSDFIKWLKCAGLVKPKVFDIKPPNRVDYVFTYACTKGPGGIKCNKEMSFPMLLFAVKGIAKERGMGESEEDIISKLAAGDPTFSATKAEKTRFHDDKSNYTGAHKYGGAHGAAAHTSAKEIRANRAMQLLEGADLDEAKRRAQMVVDTFTAHDSTGNGKMDKAELKKCLAELKPGTSDDTIDYVCKFAFQAYDENQDGELSLSEFKASYNMLVETLNSTAGSNMSPDTKELIKNKYLAFTEMSPGTCTRVEEMDSARFMKLCIDVFPKAFPATGQAGRTKADLIFAKMVSERREKKEGIIKITFEEFYTIGMLGIVDAMKEAKVAGASMDKAIAMLMGSEPNIDATAADSVRFHDDKSSYTGAHAAIHGVEKEERTFAAGWS